METIWRRYPLLFAGVAFYCGLLGPIGLLFLLLCRTWKRALFALAIGALAFLYLPKASEEVIEGSHLVKICSVRPSRSLFSKGWIVHGRVGRRRVTLFASHLPPLESDYQIEGRLEGDRLRWKGEWEPIEGTRSFEGVRLRIRRWVEERIDGLPAALLLGDLTDDESRLNFGRLGLAHIMAVSGFHLSILAFALSFLLRGRIGSLVLILGLTFYLWLTGGGAATQRAWLMAVIAIIGREIGRPASSLNSLGAALLFVLLLDPTAHQRIGFQFSFAATASILLFYTPTLHLFRSRVQKKLALPSIGQIAPQLLYRSLALLISVHLALLPLILYHFHRFPLVSLLYNLVVPLIAGVILLLSLLSLLVPPFVYLVEPLARLLEESVHYVPAAFTYTLRVDALHPVLLVGWLVFILNMVLPIVRFDGPRTQILSRSRGRGGQQRSVSPSRRPWRRRGDELDGGERARPDPPARLV